MSFKQEIKLKYYTASTTEKLIAVNVIAFIFFAILNTLFSLFNLRFDIVDDWLVFPKELSEFIYRPWTILTYAFLHAGIWHLIGNMILLHFSGRFFQTFFSGKRLLAVYIMGALAGALFYTLSYNFLPAFQQVGYSYLVGASAAVMAILVSTATYAPQMEVRLFFLGNIKIWWIAAFFVLLDLVQIPVENPGGHISHLGGALLGYVYGYQMRRGTDIAVGLENIFDSLQSMGSSATKSSEKNSPLRTVHKSKDQKASGGYQSTSYYRNTGRKNEKQEQIDQILDKISNSGYDSLTKQEKDFLFKVGKEK